MNHPHAKARALLAPALVAGGNGHADVLINALPVSGRGPLRVPRLIGPPGADNTDVYGGLLGMSTDELAALTAAGVI
jgi:hypothetical protein